MKSILKEETYIGHSVHNKQTNISFKNKKKVRKPKEEWYLSLIHILKYSARTAYTPRELKTREDWNEWQADVLGAAIMLPQKEVDLAMRRFVETPLINYEGRYSYGDHLTDVYKRQGQK